MNIDHRFCAVVNTHETYHDVLTVFLKCYERYVSGIDLFVFSNAEIKHDISAKYRLIKYTADNFRDQYLECLMKISHDYILTFNDDYFVIDNPRYQQISRCIDILEKSNYSHIRLVRGANFSPLSQYEFLYPMNNKQPYFFSQTLSLWKRSDLVRVFETVGPSGIGRKRKEVQFEVLANKACEQLGMTGLVYYEGEKKVGSAHYECNLIPHVVSAIVDGYWNTREYSNELLEIENKFHLQLNPARNKSLLRSLIDKFLP